MSFYFIFIIIIIITYEIMLLNNNLVYTSTFFYIFLPGRLLNNFKISILDSNFPEWNLGSYLAIT